MPDLRNALEQWFPWLFAAGLVWVLFCIGLSLVYRRWKGKAIFADRPSNAAFLETWTSGRSKRSALTKLGGAQNCLLVAVTDESLIVQPHFPFTLLLLPEIYDLEHVIPRASIRSVTQKQAVIGRQYLEISFDLPSGETRLLELRLRQPQQFLEALHAP